MRNALGGVLAVAVALSLAAAARADIPPPPPAGLEHSPALAPMPVAVAGLAAALAVAAAGVVVARFRGGWIVRIAAIAAAAAILIVAGFAASSAARARQDYDALKARYDDELAHWHPHGPELPRRYFEAPLAASVFAAAPQAGLPSSIPWTALASIQEGDARAPWPVSAGP